MKKLAGLAVLVAILFSVTACNVTIGADEDGKKWIALMDKHKKLLEEGKFDAKAFEAEAKPIAEALKKHRGSSDQVSFRSEDVLKDFKRATNEFENVLKEKGSEEQKKMYLDIRDLWNFKQPAGNSAGNAPPDNEAS